MVDLAESVWRDFVTDGVPASGANKPKKQKIREWGAWMEAFVSAFGTNGGLIFQGRAALFADLDHPSLTMVWVVNDATAAYNGIYQKQGASGTGSWVRLLDLPYSFIRLTDAGTGTANAIVATSSIPLPASPSAALLVMNVFEANTGDVTIAVNGAAAKPLVTNTGNALSSGYLAAGMFVAFLDTGTNFRLLTDIVSSSIVAAAEAAALAAEGHADDAEAALAALLAAGFSGDYVTPETYLAVGDAVRVEPCVTTSGSPNVNCVNANWTAGDVGKVFFLHRGGAAGVDTRAQHLVSTILTVTDGQNIVLAQNVQQTLSTARAAYGTDDTQAWQDALTAANLAGNPLKTAPGAKYLVTEPIGSLTTGLFGGDRDSWIYAAYTDNDVVDGSESLFYVESDNVSVVDMGFEWFGYFKKSYISAICHWTGNDARYINVRATGFSNAGIQYGSVLEGGATSAATSRGLIQGCHLYGNRRQGMSLGDATDTKIIGNWFIANGLLGDGGAGYGCAGQAGSIPYNTLIMGNHANDNMRRGLDFHSGLGIKIVGNFCLRNKIAGIYAEDTSITGDVIIEGNTVGEMTWNGAIASGVPGEGSAPTMFGIHVGAQAGQGIAADPTNIVIANNVIYDFTQTADGCYPIFAHAGGLSKGAITITGNSVRAGVCVSVLRFDPSTSGTPGNYYDAIIYGNSLEADECTSIPVYYRSGQNRKKVFKGNMLIVGAVTATSGAMSYDTTVISGKSYLVEGNIVNVPAAAWSTGFDWCMTKRVADENVRNNIVNNVKVRDFDGVIFTDRMAAAPSSGIFWTIGSRVINSAAPGPGVVTEWLRITAGSTDVVGTDWLPNYPQYILQGSATFDCPSLADGAGTTTTITVTGAAVGDFCMVSVGGDYAGMSITSQVSAANTVQVRVQNESGGVLDPASVTLRARVFKL